jgi:hypothetical protein
VKIREHIIYLKCLKIYCALLLFISCNVCSYAQSVKVNPITSVNSEVYETWKLEPFGKFDPNQEILSKRDEFSKHFKQSDGSILAHIAAGPIHYQENGEWKTIYHCIKPNGYGGFENTTNAHKTYFPALLGQPLRTQLPQGVELKEMMGMELFFETNGQTSIPQAIQPISGTAQFNELRYSNVFGNSIDLRLTQNTTQRKMDFILKNASIINNAPENADFLVFRELVELPIGWTAKLVEGEIHLKDESGKLLAKYDRPYFYEIDDLTNHQHFASHEETENHNRGKKAIVGNFVIKQIGNQLEIFTKVPMTWLKDPERNFPVYIDPTLTLNPDNTANWTGSVNTWTVGNSGNGPYTSTNIHENFNDRIFLGHACGDGYYDGSSYVGGSSISDANDLVGNGWIKFNTSSVPSGKCVTGITLNTYFYSSYLTEAGVCVTNVKIRNMNTDPVSVNDANRLNDIRDGTIYADVSFTGNPNLWKTHNLAITTYNDMLSGSFSVGLETYGTNQNHHSHEYVLINGHSSSNKPFINLTYLDDITMGAFTLNSQAADVNACSGQTITVNHTGWNNGGGTIAYWVGIENPVGSGWVTTWSILENACQNQNSCSFVMPNIPSGSRVVVHSNGYNSCGWGSGVTRYITLTCCSNIAITGITSVLCGNSTQLSVGTMPTGGTITSSSGFNIHSFMSSGTFVTGTFPIISADALVVAGGGGGGSNGGGGGGGGGVIYTSGSSLSTSTSYPVTVGSGGIAALSSTVRGSNGNNSAFNGITANGGGGGASRDGGGAGNSGGAGGGGAGAIVSPQFTAGSGTAGQGSSGGAGTGSGGDQACNSAGGGGGGAGGAGAAATNNQGGNGGPGISNSITGSSVNYGGGGGGGTTNFGGCNSTLIPTNGSNSIVCGNATKLCTHAGCGNLYSSSVDGFTVINATSGTTINITGTYALEACNCDYIYIYAGSGISTTPVATYTNGSGNINYTGSPGQTLTVRFKSDGSVVNSGLNSTISFTGGCSPVWSNGSGGSGGGGNGESTNGLANTGGGGGAERAGGSGVVIIRYPIGTWSSSNTTVATVDQTGLVAGLTEGIATISYTINGCSYNTMVSVLQNTSSTASSSTTVCLNSVLTNITHTTTGATGIGSPSGLPPGVSASWSSNTITISGTPTSSGIYSYSIPLSGGCGTVNATGTITVIQGPSPPAGTSTQTFCASVTPLVSLLTATGTDIKWYSLSSGGSPLPSTLGLSNGGIYYASQTVSGCESIDRFAVTVVVNPVPVIAAVTGTTTICHSTNSTLTLNYPTGGTVLDAGGYRTHTFTSNGALTVPTGFSGLAEVLVIAGGGGGGGVIGGGGGAGGIQFSTINLTSGSKTVVVGAGGIGGVGWNNVGQQGGQGGNSQFDVITSIGGGGGGLHGGASGSQTNLWNGGSGGGSGSSTTGLGAGTVGQGQNGGYGGENNGGGGGGFAGVGGNGLGSQVCCVGGTSGGAGGSGIYFPQFIGNGSPAGWFAGGGGGGTRDGNGTAGSGSNGGGTAGTNTTTQATAALANTGGGGGGGGYNGNSSLQIGGNGGSGIVIIRYYIGTGTWASNNLTAATVANGIVAGTSIGGISNITYTVPEVAGCGSSVLTVPIVVLGGERLAPTGSQCSGSQLNFQANPNPSVTGTSISWAVTAPAGLTASPTTGSSNSFSTILTNSTSSNLSPTISLTQTLGGLTCLRDFTPVIKPNPSASISSTTLCVGSGNTATLTATGGGTYLWSPGGQTTNQISINTPGNYSVDVTSNGCTSSANTTVTVSNPPSIISISPP